MSQLVKSPKYQNYLYPNLRSPEMKMHTNLCMPSTKKGPSKSFKYCYFRICNIFSQQQQEVTFFYAICILVTFNPVLLHFY